MLHGMLRPNEWAQSIQQDNSFQMQRHIGRSHAEITLNIHRIVSQEIRRTVGFPVNMRNLAIGDSEEPCNAIKPLSNLPVTFSRFEKLSDSQRISFHINIMQTHIDAKNKTL